MLNVDCVLHPLAGDGAVKQPNDDSAFISIQGVSYRYPRSDAPALTSIDLTIPRGRIFGLLGPNGAGKTTLLSILTGVLPVQQGDVRVAGLDARLQAAEIKAISGLVPQDYAFYPALTARENLRFFAGVYRLSRGDWLQRLDHCVHACQLQEVLDQRAEQYSGGMKRRLNLAIGLLSAPEILYLDEPTVGVDARSRQCIVAAIRALTTVGTTVVYTSHYMEEVEAICDELAIVDRGRIIVQDRMDRLLHRGANKLLTIVLAQPLPSGAQVGLAAWQPVSADRLRWTFSLPGGAPQIADVLELIGCSRREHRATAIRRYPP